MAGKKQIEMQETLWVEREGKEGKRRVFHDQREETIAVHVFATEPSVFRLSKGLTMKVADYESVRVDADLRRPCYVEQEEETIASVKRRVDEVLEEELSDLVKLMRERE